MFSKREYSQSDSGAVKKAGLRAGEKLLLIVPLLALLGFSAWHFRDTLRNLGGARNIASPADSGVPVATVDGNATPAPEDPVIIQPAKPERFFPAPEGDIYGVTFSGDDRLLAITTLDSKSRGAVNRVALWDVNARKKLWQKTLGNNFPYCALSPDGATLAVLTGKSYGADAKLNASAVAYDAKSGRKLFQRLFARNSLPFALFAFSPDGTLLSLPSRPPQWLDAKSGEVARTFKDAGDNSSVTFLGHARYSILTARGRFQTDNKAFHFFPPAPQPYSNMKTAPTTIRVFEAKTNRLIATLPQRDAFWSEPMPRPDKFFTATLAACDGKKFFDGKVQLYDAKNAAPREAISITSTNCVFSGDNAQALLIAPHFAPKPQYSTSTLMLYDLTTKRVLWQRDLPFPQYEVGFLPGRKRGAMTISVRDKTTLGWHRALEIFSLRDGKARRTIVLEPYSRIMDAPLSPAGKWLFDARAKGVGLWSAS